MYICPECRSVYQNGEQSCERDRAKLIPVQANQDPRTYPLLNHELDGRYHLIGGLGQGGVGTVYLANHIHLDQLSAVKFLDIDMLGEVDEEQREESQQDFVKEAKLAMMLRHDHVVRVMDYGIHQGSPFLVMEYIPGPSLLRRMNAGERFTVPQCMNIIKRLAEALSAFHDRKLVHRDLKPANVILDPRDNGELTLVDLGLVKDLSNEARSSTHPLALRGTPGYLAPEQVPGWVLSSAGVNITAEKQPVDARVDIFALGVLAFELLTGETTYPKGMSPTKVIVHTCTTDPPEIDSLCPEAALHEGLIPLVKSMMARNPSERPLDASAVLDALKQVPLEPKSTLENEVLRVQHALGDYQASPPPSRAGLRYSAPLGVSSTPAPTSTASYSGLIPPPASLSRNSGASRFSELSSADQSTVLGEDQNHFLDGTIDEDHLEDQFGPDVPSLNTESVLLDFQEDETRIQERALPRRTYGSLGPTPSFAFQNSTEIGEALPLPKEEGISKLIWLALLFVLVVGSAFWIGSISNENIQPKRVEFVSVPLTKPSPSHSTVTAAPVSTTQTQQRPQTSYPSQLPAPRPLTTGQVDEANPRAQEEVKAQPDIVEIPVQTLSTASQPSPKEDITKTRTGTQGARSHKQRSASSPKKRKQPRSSSRSRTADRAPSRGITEQTFRALNFEIAKMRSRGQEAEACRLVRTKRAQLKMSNPKYLQYTIKFDDLISQNCHR